LKIANYYQKLARATIEKGKMSEELARIKATMKGKDIERAVIVAKQKLGLGIPRNLEWLEGANIASYIAAMKFAQQYARVNRLVIAAEICQFLRRDFVGSDIIESVHNYIEFTEKESTIRKGAIRAAESEMCVIPMNMSDGVLLCEGKGNNEWNCSAPHGAGRLMSRSNAKRTLKLEDYIQTMKEKGVWTSCVSHNTLDEAPGAYKPMESIVKAIGETVKVLDVWKPVYNFKASE
jgi:RNA-splicing ligase RtcB